MDNQSMISNVRTFLRHVLPAVLRPIRTLWNEIVGFVFLVLALWAVPSAIRSLREFDGDLESFFKLILTGFFVLLMCGFGIFSFLRARKISRS